MKANKNEFELIVSEGNRPLWMRIIAASFFFLMLYFLYELIVVIYYRGFDQYFSKALPRFVESIAYCLSGGIAFSVTKTVLIDVDKDVLISRFCVGPFSRGVNSKVPQLEYVSVFLDSKENFQVNLWYVGNKHYKMYSFEEKEPAMKFGQMVSEKLKIDLLDATEKGNSKWIEITKP